ncbi:MAG: MerR family transcriptional regulator [Bacteroidales bacterium]|nr:MerR family transcriptional regulator [Bacteroidales bacterium]
MENQNQEPQEAPEMSDGSKVISDEEIKNLDKLYYSIGEVAKMFDANASQIRYWEKEFQIIKPKKNNKGNRQFTKKDIENIKKIHFLVKDRGMTLEGAKKHLKSHTQEDGVANFEVIKILQDMKKKLLEMKEALDVVPEDMLRD